MVWKASCVLVERAEIGLCVVDIPIQLDSEIYTEDVERNEIDATINLVTKVSNVDEQDQPIARHINGRLPDQLILLIKHAETWGKTISHRDEGSEARTQDTRAIERQEVCSKNNLMGFDPIQAGRRSVAVQFLSDTSFTFHGSYQRSWISGPPKPLFTESLWDPLNILIFVHKQSPRQEELRDWSEELFSYMSLHIYPGTSSLSI